MKDVKFVLMDIEGTTTSISFVYDVLFPYFQRNIQLLTKLKNVRQVKNAFEEVKEIVRQENNIEMNSSEEIIDVLLTWSNEDRKLTPLKTVQGILWETAYKSGEIVGHIYPDVPSRLMDWKNKGIRMGIFSSGSVSAQKLLFGYSSTGDLNKYFESNFDTKTGSKRDSQTYLKIAKKINFKPENILFLSDVKEELQAAHDTGYQTIQITREGTEASWTTTANNFYEIDLD